MDSTTKIKHTPQHRVLSDGAVDFIHDDKLMSLLHTEEKTDKGLFHEIIARSLDKQPLSIEETAVLIGADSPDLVEEIFNAARRLKTDVYGNRIVIFAPLYIGNYCVNNCLYCGFRRDN